MITVEDAVASCSPLKLWAAVKQREEARKAKQLAYSSLQRTDWKPTIRKLQLQMEGLQEQLETIEERQRILPDTLQSMLTKCEHWTREIAVLKRHMPKDAVGKIALQIQRLNLEPTQRDALLAEIRRMGAE